MAVFCVAATDGTTGVAGVAASTPALVVALGTCIHPEGISGFDGLDGVHGIFGVGPGVGGVFPGSVIGCFGGCSGGFGGSSFFGSGVFGLFFSKI